MENSASNEIEQKQTLNEIVHDESLEIGQAVAIHGESHILESQSDATTSLALIAAAYDNSDSESEHADIMIINEYRNTPAVVTSDEESDDDDDDSSSSSSSSSSECSDAELDQRDDSNKKNGKSKRGSEEKGTRGEFDDLPPIEDLKISVPEVICDPLGEVGWTVEQMVVVRPKPGKPTLNLDTILFVDRGKRVLGRIFDVFGQVTQPHYCVRFNSNEHIEESQINIGMTVYFCPNTEYTSLVFLQDLLKMKATDELGDDEHPEFSDDEEERAYYAALKEKKQRNGDSTKKKVDDQTGQNKRRKTRHGDNHPWSAIGKQHPQQSYSQRNGHEYLRTAWHSSYPYVVGAFQAPPPPLANFSPIVNVPWQQHQRQTAAFSWPIPPPPPPPPPPAI